MLCYNPGAVKFVGGFFVKASTSRKLARPADEVWRIAGRFNGLPDTSSMTAASELIEGGQVRKLTPAGSSGYLLERLLRYDDVERTFHYIIEEVTGVEGMAYGIGYRGTLHIKDDEPGKSCIYSYSAEFAPLPGVSEAQGQEAVESFVQDSIDGACRLLGLAGRS